MLMHDNSELSQHNTELRNDITITEYLIDCCS